MNNSITIKNPIIFADYSDPDVIRVGDTYYMTASSFNYTPGLPILVSKNLYDWSIVNYAVHNIGKDFEKPRHSEGIWAPSIRFHDGIFYIYYGMPDEGLFVVKTDDPLKKWDDPVCILKGKGLIDPCPLWDDDSRVYLVHAYAKSRIGFKSILGLIELSSDGLSAISEDKFIFNGNIAVTADDGIIRESSDTGFGDAKAEFTPDETEHPCITIEGPKIYKRDGFYIILAPAGGVVRGHQIMLRSKSICGSYEGKVVLHQGASVINGPHQGGLVDTPDKKEYFIHFQDRGLYGRICHIQPVKWADDGFCVIGEEKEKKGTGEPVKELSLSQNNDCYFNAGGQLPDFYAAAPKAPHSMSDEFKKGKMSLIWQWMGDNREDFTVNNYDEERIKRIESTSWIFGNSNKNLVDYAGKGLLLKALNLTGKKDALIWESPNVLTMKLTKPEFATDIILNISKLKRGDRAGAVMTGAEYCFIEIRRTDDDRIKLVCGESSGSDKEKQESIKKEEEITDSFINPVKVERSGNIYTNIILRLNFSRENDKKDRTGTFASADSEKPVLKLLYSFDGRSFTDCGITFLPSDHTWVGSKLGIYAVSSEKEGGMALFEKVITSDI